jgi:protein arginine N-methyltransferase 5
LLAPDAISIPQRYDSIVVPVSSEYAAKMAQCCNWTESLFIFRIQRAFELAPPMVCFRFEHPGPTELYVHSQVEFRITRDGLLHGFAGWFEAQLFGEVMLSNSPTANSYSWYQVFFSLNDPIRVKEGDLVRAAFSRKSDGVCVWYEWALLHPEVSHIYNANGKQCRMRLLTG